MPATTVAEAFVIGDCERVYFLFDAAVPEGDAAQTAARLAAATCAVRTGSPSLAQTWLGNTDADSGLLGGYRRLVRAEASLELGDTTRALAELDGLALPGPAGRQATLLRGRLRAERGDAAAIADFEALASTPLGPEAGFYLATLHEKRGDKAAQRAALEQVWTDARPGGFDSLAAEALLKLGHTVADLASAQGRALAKKRLDALHKVNRASEAKELADALATVEPPKTREDWVLLGRVRYAGRDYAGALVAWKEAFGAPQTAKGSASELFDYALCHARTDDYDTAAVAYRRVMEVHAGTKEADFASFKLGYMAYDRGDCAKAVPLFDAHRKALPASRHLDEALWFTARCAWKAGDRAGAAQAWAALETERPKSSLVAGAAYWRARSAGLGGEAAVEKSGYEGVLRNWPTSGYAYFAAERLGRRFPAKPAATVPPWPSSLAGRSDVQRAEALLSAGLRSWAQGELEGLPDPASKADALAVGWARLRAGDVVGAKRIGCKHAGSVWQGGDPVAQQLCTPRPEQVIVSRSAVGIEPAVIYGVMQAESALDPVVTSAVGARGLMQLMPEVAHKLHIDVFPGRTFFVDDLFSAPYNASLGTRELSDRARTLAGTLVPTPVPAVIASYNAGEEAVRRWIDTPQPPPSDEWTEDISYVETRGYVKRVLGFAMAYRWVYGDG